MHNPALIISFFFFLFLNIAYSSTRLTKFHSWKKIGFLSQGNYQTVQHLIPNATPTIVKHQSDMYQLIENGTLDAGLISGVPDEKKFVLYPSGSISPRGMFTRPRKSNNDNSLRQLMDAAIVRLAMSGKLQEFAAKNAPFEFVEVHTCRSSTPDHHLPFPPVNRSIINSTIRVGALGPYNWHQDGNYTATPPTGFWPDVLSELDKILGDNYTLVRTYYPGSNGVMDALQNGEVDVTEPYWTVDSFYGNRPRTWTFEHGCTVLGYESTFFEKRISPVQISQKTPTELIVIIVVAAVLLLMTITCIAFLVCRERSGRPVFSQLLDDSASPKTINGKM